MKRAAVVLSIAALALSVVHAGDEPQTSKKLDQCTYKEELGPVTVIIGCKLAMMIRGEDYWPIEIAVGIHGRKSPRLVIDRSSFVLVRSSGSAHPLLPVDGVDHGEKIAIKNTIEISPVNIGFNFDDFSFARTNFSPTIGEGTQRLELAGQTYFRDVLYFPRLDIAPDEILTFQFMARGLERPMQIRFRIPGTVRKLRED